MSQTLRTSVDQNLATVWLDRDHGNAINLLKLVRSRNDKPEAFAIRPHKGPGYVLSLDGNKALAHTKRGELLKFKAGPEGAWLSLKVRYVKPEKPVTLACSPERWFATGFHANGTDDGS